MSTETLEKSNQLDPTQIKSNQIKKKYQKPKRATQLLADLGAEVIKIEKPQEGDDTRTWGPPFVQVGSTNFSGYFLCTNRNKKSVTVNFKNDKGREIVERLAKVSDVLIENYAVGTLQKMGLGYEDIRKLNPDIVYCSITGFGQTGPLSSRPGYDFLAQGLGGIMSITGPKESSPPPHPASPFSSESQSESNQPFKIGVALTDIMTGLYASNGILASIISRDHEIGNRKSSFGDLDAHQVRERNLGAGRHIDLGLFDVQLGVLANQGMNYLLTGRAPRRLGNSHPSISPYDSCRAKDGHIILAVGNNEQVFGSALLLCFPTR